MGRAAVFLARGQNAVGLSVCAGMCHAILTLHNVLSERMHRQGYITIEYEVIALTSRESGMKKSFD